MLVAIGASLSGRRRRPRHRRRDTRAGLVAPAPTPLVLPRPGSSGPAWQRSTPSHSCRGASSRRSLVRPPGRSPPMKACTVAPAETPSRTAATRAARRGLPDANQSGPPGRPGRRPRPAQGRPSSPCARRPWRAPPAIPGCPGRGPRSPGSTGAGRCSGSSWPAGRPGRHGGGSAAGRRGSRSRRFLHRPRLPARRVDRQLCGVRPRARGRRADTGTVTGRSRR